jgi:NAD(P)-dependent dehydrogenase (short-subunit alcohol dehydrogenase family)
MSTTNPPKLKEQAGAKPKSPLPPQTQPKPGLDSAMTPEPQYLAPNYKGSEKLAGKVAIVTGGDSGIGRSVSVLFAREGANVAIVYLPEEQSDAEVVKQAVEAEGQVAFLLPGDVSDPKFCRDVVEKTVKKFGHLDVLVNNAAYQETRENFDDVSEADWDRTFKVNIYGYFYMAKAALKHLKPGSVIINCGSITGLEGNKTLIDYATTKGAIHAFTKSLAMNLADRKIRVNCVAPGPIWTPLQPVSKSAEEVADHGADTPMKRPGQPEEVAPAFVFFASNADSSYISGEIMTILGGDTRAG